tara:strand:+ start:214 stop:555 length:342 start_codon:yes stop_codon:yes gene_type:complete
MKGLLLLIGAIPLAILVVALAKQRDFSGDGYPGWEAVEELADKYDLTIGTQNAFGPSHCSTAFRIYSDASSKDKNINSYEELKADPLFGRVRAWAYHACRVQKHKDWPGPLFG